MTAAIRVVVVDSEPRALASIPTLLEDDWGIICVDTAASAGQAHEQWARAERAPADVVLVDLRLPDEDGLTLSLWLTTREPAPAVVISVPAPSEELLLPALVAGAAGVVTRGCPARTLHAAVRAAAAGAPWQPAVAPAVVRGQGGLLAPEDLPILGMLRHGVPWADIAATLGLEPSGLVARRWAMLETLTGGQPERAEPRRARRGLSAVRTLSPASG